MPTMLAAPPLRSFRGVSQEIFIGAFISTPADGAGRGSFFQLFRRAME